MIHQSHEYRCIIVQVAEDSQARAEVTAGRSIDSSTTYHATLRIPDPPPHGDMTRGSSSNRARAVSQTEVVLKKAGQISTPKSCLRVLRTRPSVVLRSASYSAR